MTTHKPGTVGSATISALMRSENLALTEFAIREQVGSMRAVPSLERRGMVTVEVGDEWIEDDDYDRTRKMTLRSDVVTVRLVWPQLTA